MTPWHHAEKAVDRSAKDAVERIAAEQSTTNMFSSLDWGDARSDTMGVVSGNTTRLWWDLSKAIQRATGDAIR
jgi:hypothetical protein